LLLLPSLLHAASATHTTSVSGSPLETRVFIRYSLSVWVRCRFHGVPRRARAAPRDRSAIPETGRRSRRARSTRAPVRDPVSSFRRGVPALAPKRGEGAASESPAVLRPVGAAGSAPGGRPKRPASAPRHLAGGMGQTPGAPSSGAPVGHSSPSRRQRPRAAHAPRSRSRPRDGRAALLRAGRAAPPPPRAGSSGRNRPHRERGDRSSGAHAPARRIPSVAALPRGPARPGARRACRPGHGIPCPSPN